LKEKRTGKFVFSSRPASPKGKAKGGHVQKKKKKKKQPRFKHVFEKGLSPDRKGSLIEKKIRLQHIGEQLDFADQVN